MNRKFISFLFASAFILSGRTTQAKTKKGYSGVITPTNLEMLKKRIRLTPFTNKLKLFFGIEPKKIYDWQDNRGKSFWTVRNQAGYPINVSSDIHRSVIIEPGKAERVYRGEKWNLVVTLKVPHENIKYKERINTQANRQHYIDAYFIYKQWRPQKIRDIELVPRK